MPEFGIRGSLQVAPEWSGSLGGQETELVVSGTLGLLESNHCTLREVRFLVPNFPAFIGDFVRRGAGASRCRLEFAAGDWLGPGRWSPTPGVCHLDTSSSACFTSSV